LYCVDYLLLVLRFTAADEEHEICRIPSVHEGAVSDVNKDNRKKHDVKLLTKPEGTWPMLRLGSDSKGQGIVRGKASCFKDKAKSQLSTLLGSSSTPANTCNTNRLLLD